MTLLREKEEAHIVTDSDRAELQSHFPYAGIHLNELSVQEERLLLFHLRGMSKAAAGRAAGYSDIDRVFSLADVVSVHLPALPETNSLIAKKQFELLKKDAVFINTSRGSVIHEQDLIEEVPLYWVFVWNEC